MAPVTGSPEALGGEDPVARERLMAANDQQQKAYVYMPETRMWHYSQIATEIHCTSVENRSDVAVAELGADDLYELVAMLTVSDGRTRAGQQVRSQVERQLRRSGEVLTSSEIGLLSPRLPHRMGIGGPVRTLLEARSGPKRWTALYAYAETSATPRSMTRWLRNAQTLRYSSHGRRLVVQHKRRTIRIEGKPHKRLLVEAKYIPETTSAPEQGNGEEVVSDEPIQ